MRFHEQIKGSAKKEIRFFIELLIYAYGVKLENS
jgi:hypothetical protein